MLLILFFLSACMLILILYFLFFLASKKSLWDMEGSESFECGFSSYFFSHNSFSMHYFMVGLIFLFLDLELCLIMPFFSTEYPSIKTFLILEVFILLLVISVLFEWGKGILDWKF